MPKKHLGRVHMSAFNRETDPNEMPFVNAYKIKFVDFCVCWCYVLNMMQLVMLL